MKRILSVTVLIAVLFAGGAQALPAPVAQTTLKPCSIYEIYSYKEANYRAELNVGNFSAITLFADPKGVTGGQTNWVRLNLPEINFIKAINVHSYRTWAWADNNVGTIYLGSGDDWADTTVKWPRIALGSNETGANRNQVCVIERSPDGRLAHIQGIPKSADYYQFTRYPWLFHAAYTVYPSPAGVPNRTGELALYSMPLWEPSSGFTISVGGGTGLWLPVQFLARKLAEFNPNANPTPTVSPVPTLVPPIPSPTPETLAVKVADRGEGKTLAIRPSPSTNNTVLGMLYPNVTVYIHKVQASDTIDPNSLWGELSKNAWIALYYNGVYYTDYRP